MLERQLTTRILEDLTFFPAVAITGPRQVGKTTLAHTIESLLPKQCLFLDLESDSDRQKLEDAEMFLKSNLDSSRSFLTSLSWKPQLNAPLQASILHRFNTGTWVWEWVPYPCTGPVPMVSVELQPET